jgi:hypothetical protein
VKSLTLLSMLVVRGYIRSGGLFNETAAAKLGL